MLFVLCFLAGAAALYVWQATAWLRFAAVLLAVTVLALSASAAPKIELCTAKDVAATCAPPLNLPARFFNDSTPPPYDVELRFGGTRVGGNGSVIWIWLKAGESSRTCTAAELRIGRAVVAACNARIGWDPLESTCRHASLSIL